MQGRQPISRSSRSQPISSRRRSYPARKTSSFHLSFSQASMGGMFVSITLPATMQSSLVFHFHSYKHMVGPVTGVSSVTNHQDPSPHTFNTRSPSCSEESCEASPVSVICLIKIWLPSFKPYSAVLQQEKTGGGGNKKRPQ